MCLTIPKQVMAVKGGSIKLKSPKGQQQVGSLIKVKKGDWVLAQQGVIVRKIGKKQAEEINQLFKPQSVKI